MFNFLKKLAYIWLLAYFAFLVTSIFFGGAIMKEIREKTGLHYFDTLAEEGDAIKHKADSLFGRVSEKEKEKTEEKDRLSQ